MIEPQNINRAAVTWGKKRREKICLENENWEEFVLSINRRQNLKGMFDEFENCNLRYIFYLYNDVIKQARQEVLICI